MITQEYVDKTAAALAEACPLTAADPESVEALKAKLLSFDRELGSAPTVDHVIRWAIPLEQALLQKKEAREAELRQKRESANARRKEVTDYLSNSATDKAEMIREARSHQQAVDRKPLEVATNYTDEQMDKMTSDEYKRLVLQRESLPINESKPNDEMRRLQEKRLLQTPRKKDTPLRKALRREILENRR